MGRGGCHSVPHQQAYGEEGRRRRAPAATPGFRRRSRAASRRRAAWPAAGRGSECAASRIEGGSALLCVFVPDGFFFPSVAERYSHDRSSPMWLVRTWHESYVSPTIPGRYSRICTHGHPESAANFSHASNALHAKPQPTHVRSTAEARPKHSGSKAKKSQARPRSKRTDLPL